MSDVEITPVTLAQDHVRRGREIVAAQRVLIDRIRKAGLDTEWEEKLLRTFAETLAIFEDDLRGLEKEAADAGRVGSRLVGAPPRR